MSIRAYRITQPVRTAKKPSWNLWDDDKVIGWLKYNAESVCDQRNDEGAGQIEFSTADLRRMLTEIGKDLTPEARKAIEADVARAEKAGDEFIGYECR